MKKTMKKTILAFLCIFLLSSCKCYAEGVLLDVVDRRYVPKTTSVCTPVKTGEITIYIPSHGGVCFGMVEVINEKYTLYFSDGTNREVGRYEFLNTGDNVVVERSFCN